MICLFLSDGPAGWPHFLFVHTSYSVDLPSSPDVCVLRLGIFVVDGVFDVLEICS